MIIKKILLFFLLCISLANVNAQDIPEKPEPARMVNDFAGILGSNAEVLESKLRNYNDTTSTQIVVVTVASLNGYDVADFSFRLAESWGIGQKGKNNGLLILVAPNERKMRIEVGYGLEAFVTDAKSKWIIDNIMKPAFKQGDFAGGINGAIDEIIAKSNGAFERDGSETDTANGDDGSFWWIWLIIIIIIIISFKNKGGGGGYSRYSSGGSFYGGGGFSSGGGGSSFGGFGGGSFGGGGSSGDW